MTKKHFVAIASIIRNHRRGTTMDLILALTAYLATQNRLFDRERFNAAAGIGDDVDSN